MSQAAIFAETLHRLAMIDEGFVIGEAGFGLSLARTSSLDPKTTVLLQVAALVVGGAPAVCLEWSVGRALVAGASEDEIAEVLPGIAPMSGLGRVVAAAPDLATALRYDASAHAVRGRTCCKPQASGSNPLTGSQVKRGLPPLAGADPPAVCLGPG